MAYTAIDDPSAHFVTTIWTGDGGARTITGLEFKPDLIWSKTRNKTYNHMISDSSRGFNANSEVASNSTGIEGSFSAETYGYKSGHTSDGWTMVDGTDDADDQEDGNTNEPSVTYVAWSWKANGGTTSSNTDGTITSTVQADTTAGFSIVTWTGTGANATVGHGLGSALQVVLVRCRSNSGDWMMHNTNLSASTKTLSINTTDAETTESDPWYSFNQTAPTSSVFSLGAGNTTNGSSRTFVAYCFAPIQGYSKFGSYTGNGNADGPFVYTGFKLAWLMIKVIAGNTGGWDMYDNKRGAYNGQISMIQANASSAEATSDGVDFLSNGFKIRHTSGNQNGDGNTHIYLAFAEQPFVSSGGVPCTAR